MRTPVKNRCTICRRTAGFESGTRAVEKVSSIDWTRTREESKCDAEKFKSPAVFGVC